MKLNLGSGKKTKEGWINLDIAALPNTDVVWDIEKLPLPFADNYFDEILAQDILEHVEYIPILKDIHRILKTSGFVTIRVPHFTSKYNFIDPTHKKMFSINTFDFFIKDNHLQTEKDFYFGFYFEKGTKKITFERRKFLFLNPLVEKLINVSPKIQIIYESTFLSRLFPACNIEVVLVK